MANFLDAVQTLDFFGSSATAGSWTSQDATPRFTGDIDGDGNADIVGFGPAGLTIALGTDGDGNFDAPFNDIAFFGSSVTAGSWTSQDATPRFLTSWEGDGVQTGNTDLNDDGMADIVGFGPNGVTVALANGTGGFDDPIDSGLHFFGSSVTAGSWTTENADPRSVGDINGDHFADIVGFGPGGVTVALGNGDGTFDAPTADIAFFGSSATAGSWTTQNADPRFLGDLDGDGNADIIGFGPGGVTVALANGTGGFDDPINSGLDFFGSSAAAGSWTSQDLTPRAVGDIDFNGTLDIVGFGPGGVVYALGNGDGTFGAPVNDLAFFGSSAAAGSWTTQNADPRFLEDLNGGGDWDIIGFGTVGVTVSDSNF